MWTCDSVALDIEGNRIPFCSQETIILHSQHVHQFTVVLVYGSITSVPAWKKDHIIWIYIINDALNIITDVCGANV